MPHCPAHTGSEAARPAASRHAEAVARTTRASFPTSRSCVPQQLAQHGGPGRPRSPRPEVPLPRTRALALVQRRFHFRNLLSLEVAARLAVAARLDFATEVETEPGEGVGAVAADLLEGGEQLLLGLRPG